MSGDEQTFGEVSAEARAEGDVAERARRIAGIIRLERGYRWVGIYEVTETEIGAIGWTGTEAPAHIRFPITKGLSATAVKTRAVVNVTDVTKESHYLVAFGNTRSEIIVPVISRGGDVVGTIDAESDRVNAFGEEDKQFLQKCAERILPLYAKAGQP
ncbi:MAG: GAF domain-containing protein [Candidatus Acidiferrales bacterium]